MHWRNGFEARNLLTLGRKILIFLVAVIVVLLVLAFLAEAIAEVEDEDIAEDIRSRLEGWLHRHEH